MWSHDNTTQLVVSNGDYRSCIWLIRWITGDKCCCCPISSGAERVRGGQPDIQHDELGRDATAYSVMAQSPFAELELLFINILPDTSHHSHFPQAFLLSCANDITNLSHFLCSCLFPHP